MDPARQPHLDDKSSDRDIEPHLGEKRPDGVGPTRASCFLRGHIELLIKQPGSDRRESDHQRDDLQMF